MNLRQLRPPYYILLVLGVPLAAAVLYFVLDFYAVFQPYVRGFVTTAFVVVTFLALGFFKKGQASPLHRNKVNQ